MHNYKIIYNPFNQYDTRITRYINTNVTNLHIYRFQSENEKRVNPVSSVNHICPDEYLKVVQAF